jgi:hypothetical protein
MTVCIAALHQKSRSIVTVSDMMLADDYSSHDEDTAKFWPLADRWYCMFAEQASAFAPILRLSIEKLYDFVDLAGGEVPEVPLEAVKLSIESAYQTEMDWEIQQRVLGPITMTREQFKDAGLQKLGPEIFGKKVAELEAVKVPLQLLVFGFGAAKLSHIFSVNERGQCSERDVEGVFAIGSGAWAATGSLYPKSGFLHTHSLEEVVYDLCEAAFVAQTSRFVGRNANIFILFEDGRKLHMSGPPVRKLHEMWERRAKRPIPESALKIISDGLEPFVETAD